MCVYSTGFGLTCLFVLEQVGWGGCLVRRPKDNCSQLVYALQVQSGASLPVTA